jgi:hypothetical protein
MSTEQTKLKPFSKMRMKQIKDKQPGLMMALSCADQIIKSQLQMPVCRRYLFTEKNSQTIERLLLTICPGAMKELLMTLRNLNWRGDTYY